MMIFFFDGGTMECSTIEFSYDGKRLIADDYRVIPLDEVMRITTD